MILNKEQKQAFVLEQNPETQEWVYNYRFLQKKFSRTFFGDWMSFFTNIIMFDAPVQIQTKKFDNCLVIVGEIQHQSIMAAVAIQRLYCSLLGTLITEYTQKECCLDDNVLLLENKQLSFGSTKQINDTVVFHIFIPLADPNEPEMTFLTLEEEKLNELKQKAYDGYYYLTRSVFFECQEA